MHVVVSLPDYDHAQIDALTGLARKCGLGLHSMAPHYNERLVVPGLMLGYCGLSRAQLRDATQLFVGCLDTIDATARSHDTNDRELHEQLTH
jgi:GntR family transcriptional regulator/MocR family aminotransferase